MLYYLATPYSRYPRGIEGAYQMACRQAAVLLKAGIAAYSPIAHTHSIARYGNIDPFDHSIWMPFDTPFMKVCDALIVVKAEGWDDSIGVEMEIDAFEEAGKPIHYMELNTVPPELV